ncbi:S8 family peptidase [Spirosoma montaniterrae]|uniref:Peptidase S8 n=1 Tax=Spirosoma montaniterrae TaxID=1178516 RepID=A0A1P9WSZ2_9BACT|nr:S8 family peptidase [Spirosoma montaniterrae]AQG78505.1 peptidase S8 [Spirosoma montaniterrae]
MNPRSFLRLIVAACLLLPLLTEAQLPIRNSRWRGTVLSPSDVPVFITFGRDTLLITTQAGNALVEAMEYRQQSDTLYVRKLVGSSPCGTGVMGRYRLAYLNSAEQFSLQPINDDCLERTDLLASKTPFARARPARQLPLNWPHLDPETDSIAGISLYRAYELLKGLPSVPVTVAVLDSGVDIAHEDLKDVIWANPNETPDNNIDDDRNGYADDYNGWNFMGAKDGTTYEYDQPEITQTYLLFRNKFDKANPAALSPAEKRQYDTYQRAKTLFLQRQRIDTVIAYNPSYNARRAVGDDPADPTERYYGSPTMRIGTSEQLAVHGSHVAGIIGAKRGNGRGIDGVADNVRIMPVSVVPANGDERDKDVANGIRYAVENGAKVINMSFGKRLSPFKEQIDAAIRFAEERDVLIVHAAGNNGENYDSLPSYPSARYENGQVAQNVLVVGNSSGRVGENLASRSSNYGPQTVDLFAPGSGIVSTTPNNGYAIFSGTSMAAPCVAGVAALLRSYFPNLTAIQVKEILLKSSYKPDVLVRKPGRSDEKIPFKSLSRSGGLLNAYGAVKTALAK